MITRLLAVLAAPLLALAVTAAPASAAGSAGHAACTANYNWKDGYEGLASVPYAAAEWTANGCDLDMQTAVHSGTGCYTFKSGVVHGTGIWDQASGTAGTPFCSGWIRFRCTVTGCTWHAWQRLGSSARLE